MRRASLRRSCRPRFFARIRHLDLQLEHCRRRAGRIQIFDPQQGDFRMHKRCAGELTKKRELNRYSQSDFWESNNPN
jgi:hypothetical protein